MWPFKGVARREAQGAVPLIDCYLALLKTAQSSNEQVSDLEAAF